MILSVPLIPNIGMALVVGAIVFSLLEYLLGGFDLPRRAEVPVPVRDTKPSKSDRRKGRYRS